MTVGKPKGSPKTGGRIKGTPNRKTEEFNEELKAKGFSLEEKIVNLFNSTQNEQIQFNLIELVAKYKLAIPKFTTEESEPITEDASDIINLVRGNIHERGNTSEHE